MVLSNELKNLQYWFVYPIVSCYCGFLWILYEQLEINAELQKYYM